MTRLSILTRLSCLISLTGPAAIVNRRALRVCLLLVCIAGMCSRVWAQNQQTITIRMIDNRTGLLIPSSYFLVRIDHQQLEHGDWVKKSEDGTGALTLPADANLLSVHATYDTSSYVYANCDADKDRGSAEHAPSPDRWYSVAKILSDGVVAPNNCIGKKVPDRLQVIAKPGEFVFFVRELNAMEKFRQ
ncbi:MAG: hypothetical protein ABSG96_28340 [Terracidiphilus sp.]